MLLQLNTFIMKVVILKLKRKQTNENSRTENLNNPLVISNNGFL